MLEFKPLRKRASTEYIIIHHSASNTMHIQDIHRDHLSRGWAGTQPLKIANSDDFERVYEFNFWPPIGTDLSQDEYQHFLLSTTSFGP